MRRWLSLTLLLVVSGAACAGDWERTVWNGEAAWGSSSGGWRAVVSVTRARLMHFGPEGADTNLLLAPATRENRNRLGGHRLWLGPQAQWRGGWPPPTAWEYSEPASVAVADGVLRLVMPPTGDDWPQLTRTYRWEGAALVCGAEFSGGARPAQFIQIFQVPSSMVVSAQVRPETDFPAGYVRLPSTAGPFAARFPPPVHASLTGDTLTLHHTGEVGKFGFRPQPLAGHLGGYELVVARGAQSGQGVGEPDEGFHAQVYLSAGGEAFTELEQLSPLFAPGTPARFEVVLTGRPLAADLLGRITAAAQAREYRAAFRAGQEARAWLVGLPVPPEVKTMPRRERLELALRVVAQADSALDKDYKPEPFYVNVWVPGVPIAGMDPEAVTDPEVRKRYEQAIEENRLKIERGNAHTYFTRLKEEGLGHVHYFATGYYARDPADLAELSDALQTLQPQPSLRVELAKVLGLGGG